MVRDGKPKGFFYLDHRTVDGKANIITDTHVTAANIHDSLPYLERLDYQKAKFGFGVESVGLDAGYFTPAVCKGINERNIFGVISYRKPNHKKGYMYKRQFQYLREEDVYLCPGGQKLSYKTTSRDGYRQYHSKPEECRGCPLLQSCTRSKGMKKVVTRHVWENDKEKINQNRLTDRGKKVYARRKETVERSFADSKELHGFRYAKFRGRSKVEEQCLLTAAVQNMKKLARWLG